MARSKGLPKTGGRKKGTLNKKTMLLSKAFEDEGINVGQELVQLYKTQPSNDKKLEILLKILDYCYPRCKTVDHETVKEDGKDQNSIKIEFM